MTLSQLSPMPDLSVLLTERSQTITAQWVEAVIQDQQIKSADQLSPTAIRDHIPHILAALATVLAETQESDIETIIRASLQHGALRAGQGFDPTEIAREYHLLRSQIIHVLRADLLQCTAEEVLRAVALIDAVVDGAIAQCFKSYVAERLQELDKLRGQLLLTNQELDRLVHSSQENLSVLAHELKTPLTSIIGYSELFLRQQQPVVRDTPHSLEHIERVVRNSRQLLRLINDTLELSRYEAGQMLLRLEPTNVRGVIQTVFEVIQPLAAASGLQLLLDDERAPDRVVTDPLRLQQILVNLMSNAIRYTEVGSVTLQCRVLSDGWWLIAVIDTGIGIDEANQAHVFEPFFQVLPSEPDRLTNSTGLGLAIVARMVKLLQGEISLTSEVGVGSTFTVVLPLETQSSDEQPNSTVVM
ncbi:HAMP domain-containing sensor histidine kinase [Leptolyngbya sp. FACHB-321]|uniref:sensor histidine kinase n=1 Tax=Leptolyngbya sp. FACHB-321 TaxID=2692807 RepID=UPI001F5568C0|nr:HAMP domain-containing sensor histidine kinase [Leptolyngbya sp. FACHB-321]